MGWWHTKAISIASYSTWSLSALCGNQPRPETASVHLPRRYHGPHLQHRAASACASSVWRATFSKSRGRWQAGEPAARLPATETPCLVTLFLRLLCPLAAFLDGKLAAAAFSAPGRQLLPLVFWRPVLDVRLGHQAPACASTSGSLRHHSVPMLQVPVRLPKRPQDKPKLSLPAPLAGLAAAAQLGLFPQGAARAALPPLQQPPPSWSSSASA